MIHRDPRHEFPRVGEISCQSVSVRAKHIWQAELPEGQLNDQNRGGVPCFKSTGTSLDPPRAMLPTPSPSGRPGRTMFSRVVAPPLVDVEEAISNAAISAVESHCWPCRRRASGFLGRYFDGVFDIYDKIGGEKTHPPGTGERWLVPFQQALASRSLLLTCVLRNTLVCLAC